MVLKILILTSLMLTSCGNNTVKTDRPNPLLLVNSTKDTLNFVVLQTLDTMIALSNLVKSNYNGQNLTDGIAKKTLYAYFKRKGCYNADNLPEMDKLTDADGFVARIPMYYGNRIKREPVSVLLSYEA